jgi:hypothetical protein
VRGSVRLIEDILLSERDGGSESRGNDCAYYYLANRGREGSRDGTQESAGFSKNVKKSGPLMMGDRGQVLV